MVRWRAGLVRFPLHYNALPMKVIVIALHGCPLASLGPYGNEWIATPNLDRLASESIAFDNHISDCPDSAAARRVWRTGTNRTSAEPDLLSIVKHRGGRAVLIRNNRMATDAPAEFYDGWGELFDARPDPADPSPLDALLRVLPAALDRLADAESWLLWIEIDRLTPPWVVKQDVFDVYIEDLHETDEGDDDREPVRPWADPPTGWFDKDDLASWELLHRTVAAVVTVFDAELGEVFELFRSRGLDRSATLVLTADRGWSLGEHGLVGPFRPWLHRELVQVPLIVRLPNAAEAGRRVMGLTQPPDLFATLAEWFGTPATTGHSLVPLMTGRAEAVRECAITVQTTAIGEEWAIRTPEWAFLLPVRTDPEDDPREPLLFAQPDDPWEVDDCHSRESDVVEELERRLRDAASGLLRSRDDDEGALGFVRLGLAE